MSSGLVAERGDAVPLRAMEGREERDPGFDDWFDEPEPPQGRGTRAVLDDDAWVLPEQTPRGRSLRREPLVIGGREFGMGQVAIVGVCALALLLGILAVAGVFNSGPRRAAQTLTSQGTTTPPAVSPSVTTPTVSTTPSRAPTQPVSPGDTGTQVVALQKALIGLGFLKGKADGDYGPTTQLAVEQFQSAHSLAVDGVVGQQTLAALQKAVGG